MAVPTDHALKEALRDFQDVLTPDQHKELLAMRAVPDASTVIIFTAQLDAQKAKRGTGGVSSRLYTLLQSIQQFSSVLDTFIQSNPEIAGLVWGSIKFTILVASNYSSYFDRLSALFMSFNKLCPRFEEYQILYPHSIRLQKALCDFHASIIRCCKQALQIIERTWRAQLINAIRNTFQTEFEQCEADIRKYSKDVREEISLASEQAAYQDRQLLLQEKQAASLHRNSARDIFRTVRKETKESQNWRLQKEDRELRKQRRNLLESLSTYDYHTAFKQARKKRHANTAEWLTRTSDFERWMVGAGGVLCCSGKLGSGKTVLTANVIDYLFLHKKSHDICIAFFFCRFDEDSSLNAETILRSITRQTFQADDFPMDVRQYLQDMTGTASSTIEELKILLGKMIATFKMSYFIVDALDECEKYERDTVLEFFKAVMASNSSHLNIFLTSRHGMMREVKQRFPSREHLSMGCAEAQSDIVTYICEGIDQRLETKDLVVGDYGLIKEIREALIRGAQGMFLWVAFQLDDVCSQCNDHDIRRTLQILPKNLPQTFNRALTRIHANGKAKIARQVFRWLATVERPLFLEELRDAIAIEPGQPFSKPERLVNDIQRVPAWCENLVILDEEHEAIQFVHHTVKNFVLGDARDSITKEFHFELADADHEVGEICVTYLNFNDFKTQLIRRPRAQPDITPGAIVETTLGYRSTSTLISSSVSSLVARRSSRARDANFVKNLHRYSGKSDERSEKALFQEKHPFLGYASQYWLFHTTTFKDGKSATWHLWKRMLLDRRGLGEAPWTQEQFFNCDIAVSQWIHDERHLALLHLMGITKSYFPETARNILIRRILGRLDTAQLHFYWTEGFVPLNEPSWLLCRAASVGLSDIVDHILNAETLGHVSVGRECLQDALRVATRKGHLSIVSRLLEEQALGGMDANRSDDWDPLCIASASGHTEVVTRLLMERRRYESDDHFSQVCNAALLSAAETGQLGVVKRLLAEPVMVGQNSRLMNRRESEVGFSEKIRLLNRRGPLQAAVQVGHLEIVESLLDAGADVNHGSAFQAAAEAGHLEILERLLEKGALVNAVPPHSQGLTALQEAANHGHLDILERLIAADADINAPATRINGRTALQAAAEAGHFHIVERLITAKADVNAPASAINGLTALQAAAIRGHLEIVEKLLKEGANVNAAAAEYNGPSALQAAVVGESPAIVQCLLVGGAYVDHPINTATTVTSPSAPPSTLDYPAVDSAALDYPFDRTALFLAAQRGYMEMVAMLLAANAQVEYVDPRGRTVLMAAVEEGHTAVVNIIMITSGVTDLKDAWIQPALLIAATSGHVELARRLILAGADVRYQKVDGSNPLQRAAAAGHLDIVNMLLVAGANVNDKDSYGDSLWKLTARKLLADKG